MVCVLDPRSSKTKKTKVSRNDTDALDTRHADVYLSSIVTVEPAMGCVASTQRAQGLGEARDDCHGGRVSGGAGRGSVGSAGSGVSSARTTGPSSPWARALGLTDAQGDSDAEADAGGRGEAIRPEYGQLAKTTHFSPTEVESLMSLYDKLSNELHHDGLIHKDELAWALFKAHRNNLFVDRVFELFDVKQNNVIDFEEFVTSLSVFHPSAPLEEKAAFAFSIYDINKTNYIEPAEVKRFLVAIIADNPDVHLSDEDLDRIVEDTFKQVDLTGDGRINPEEWMALVKKNPGIISYMTLPVLTTVVSRYPAGRDSPARIQLLNERR